jgi:hypothetical protein
MPANLSVSLHNDMHQIQWFTVVDNISGKTVLDCNMDDDETKTVHIASGVSGEGDISYAPRGSITIRKFGIGDGDTVDMN